MSALRYQSVGPGCSVSPQNLYRRRTYFLASQLDMGTAEVVRAHTAQDTPCGIGRSQPPQDRSVLSPKSRHVLCKFAENFGPKRG